MDQNFIITCSHCRWRELSTGLKADLKDLFEIKKGCTNCGGPRKFRCPKCGGTAKMLRVRGNA